MILDRLSNDQLRAVALVYEGTARLRQTLNQVLLEKAAGADLAQLQAELSTWAGFHDQLSERSRVEIERILSGAVEAPANLN